MNAKEWPRFVPLFSLLCILHATLSGCGSGSAGSTASIPLTPVEAPAITLQPADQSVPMGLSANFTVTATGASLQYQWAKNGAAIAGATSGNYATPATAFADSGATFTVSVSNSGGKVTSNAASLTVTARAPMAGDLRFQQVDAPSTVNGWGNVGTALSTAILGRMAQTFYPEYRHILLCRFVRRLRADADHRRHGLCVVLFPNFRSRRHHPLHRSRQAMAAVFTTTSKLICRMRRGPR